MTIAVVGTVTVVLYAVWAAAQILVFNPLAAVPGMPLDAIHAEMTAARQWSGPASALVPLAIGPVLAVGGLVAVLRRPSADAKPALVFFLSLIALGAPGYFWSSIDSNVGLADTFAVSGADYSPWAAPLYALSLAALIALVTVGIRSLRRPRATVVRNAGPAL